MKFVRKDYPTIMSGLVARFNIEGADRRFDEAEINASRDGVSICGNWPIMSVESVEEVKRTLDEAVKVFNSLSGHLSDNFSPDRVTIPANLTPGTYTLRVFGDGSWQLETGTPPRPWAPGEDTTAGAVRQSYESEEKS